VAIVNLLEETLEKLTRCGLTTADVRWVGWSNGWQVVDWPTFAALANREYDNQTGKPEIHHQLVIVGDSWWLEREMMLVEDEEGEQHQQEEWIHHALPEPLKREYQSSFFFAFVKEEDAAQANPIYQHELQKLRYLLYPDY
jgi:hypothetical protein